MASPAPRDSAGPGHFGSCGAGSSQQGRAGCVLALVNRLEENQKTELNQLLELGSSRGSLLGWLRRVPRSCSAAGILDLMQRLNWLQSWGVPRELADGIAAKRIDQLAARGARHNVAHFRRFPPEKAGLDHLARIVR